MLCSYPPISPILILIQSKKETMLPNFMEKINLSSQSIESQICRMNLQFSSEKDNVMEWKTKPPPFIYAFYNFVAENNRIPKQLEYWGFYYTQNRNNFSEYIKKNITLLKARCMRAFPSFVRDIHFYYILKESKRFDEVKYHPKIDIEYGIDFVVKYRGKRFGINCFIDTERSKKGRGKKKFRHSPVTKIVLVDLPVNFKGCKTCGQFFLYSQRELHQLINVLSKKFPSSV